MNQFFEKSVVPSSNLDAYALPDEQTSWKMSDARLDRRERAQQAAREALATRRRRIA